MPEKGGIAEHVLEKGESSAGASEIAAVFVESLVRKQTTGLA